VGRPRGAAGRTRAYLGLAHGSPGAGWSARARADLGIAPAPVRSPSTGRSRPELGCACACGSARVGWVGRTRAVMGCAASRLAPSYCCAAGSTFASASRAGVRAPGGTPAATASGRSAHGGAVLERISGGCSSCARVGSARRRVSIAHSDRAVLEPSSVERAGAACLGPRSAVFQRLGRTSAGVRGATADRRARVERARGRRLGRPQDRGARGSSRALLVGTGPTACRAGCRRATVELATTGRCSRTCSLVTPGSGAGRARARAERDRRCARRGRLVPG
jgi:hypothetical protein